MISTSTSTSTRLLRFAMACLCLIAAAESLSAQSLVRTTQDDTTIWTLGIPTVAAIVPAGTELEVVARRGDWYEVVIPPPTTVAKRIGRVLASQVEPVAASSPAAPSDAAPAGEAPAAAPDRPAAPRSARISRRLAARLSILSFGFRGCRRSSGVA